MLYGPNLILTDANRGEVLSYLEMRGFAPAELAIMTMVQLANAYHSTAPEPNGMQRITSKALAATLAAMADNVPPAPKPTVPDRVHYRFELITMIAAIGHPIMMVGPAGCGKTKMGEQAAQALNLPFYITNTITDTHELIGFIDGHGRYHRTPFRNAFENGGVWVADEIDAWEAGALLTANSALANGFAAFPDQIEPVKRHEDFKMIATANTFGTGASRVYVGRNELDAASLDRFATVEIDYDLNLERMFAAGNDRWLEHVWKVRKKVNDLKIRHVVSSRAITMGAAALKAGIKWGDVESIYLFKGMSERDLEKLK